MARFNIDLYEHSYLVDLIWIICNYSALVETLEEKRKLQKLSLGDSFSNKAKMKNFR